MWYIVGEVKNMITIRATVTGIPLMDDIRIHVSETDSRSAVEELWDAVRSLHGVKPVASQPESEDG
jgi:hypothetical protein